MRPAHVLVLSYAAGHAFFHHQEFTMQSLFHRITTRSSMQPPLTRPLFTLPLVTSQLLRQLSFALCFALPLQSLAQDVTSPADSASAISQPKRSVETIDSVNVINSVEITTGVNTSNAEATQSGYAGHTWYQRFGTGRPILIINGGPGLDSAGFAALAKALAAEGFQAIIYDQRGTGHSKITDINADTMRLQLMVEDIEQLRAHLQLPEMAILGHSFGGILAASYAAKYPQHVNQLVLSSAAGLNLQFRQSFGERLNANLTVAQQAMLKVYQARQAAGEQSVELKTQQADLLAHAYVVNKQHAPAVAARLKVVNMQINQLVHADLTAQQYDLTKAFSHFKAPVLVIQGDQDVIAPEVGQAAAAAFANASLVLLPNSAHYGWLDQPALFYQHLLDFLQQPRH